jgi:hypothetical protein
LVCSSAGRCAVSTAAEEELRMPEPICHAHMHTLPCPGYGCRTTNNEMFVPVMKEYRADVAAGKLPPWIWELRNAL